MNSESSKAPANWSRSDFIISLGLVAVLVGVFWPVRTHEFITYDDPNYITENVRVQAGLTWQNVLWAFRTTSESNWHPLTWLSHMLDCQWFGLNAGAHHLINVLFHGINSVLLFLVLQSMTRARWRSAFVAALFALHPLHVESVAWVSERKDVLSTCFWLLTMAAYVGYVRRPGLGRYVLTLFAFACGLMAKPMVVTLPCVLLLLDFWPLGRLSIGKGAKPRTLPRPTVPNNKSVEVVTLPRAILEKVPFLILTIASCFATYFAQHKGEAVVTVAAVPLAERLTNAALAYVRYMGKMVWPDHLAVFYPFVRDWPAWQVAAALILLLAMTLVAYWARHKHRYFTVGWLWYVGTLVPVIGLVQVGAQSMADRYTYVPLIGLFIIVAWGAVNLSSQWPRKPIVLAFSGGAVIGVCLLLTLAQIRFWRDSVTLFEHALAVTPESATGHLQLGYGLLAKGRTDEALKHFQAALQRVPWDYFVHCQVGNILSSQGKLDEAMTNYQKGLELKPENSELNNNLGVIWEKKGNLPEAIRCYSAALQYKPDDLKAHLNLGNALLAQGKNDEALRHYAESVELFPKSAPARWSMGEALMAQGKLQDASTHFQQALRLQADFPEAHSSLGLVLVQTGQTADGLAHLREAVRLKPGVAEFHFRLAMALEADKKTQAAVQEYQEALRLAPDSAKVLNNLAWLLSTHEDSNIRNGAEAVRHAERACRLTENRQAFFLGTLAAAYAEVGRFAEAVSTAQKAAEIASATGQAEIAATNQKLAKLYQAGKTYRQMSNAP